MSLSLNSNQILFKISFETNNKTYYVNDILLWLLYHDNTLEGVVTLRDGQVKVLEYFYHLTNSIVCNSTLEKNV